MVSSSELFPQIALKSRRNGADITQMVLVGSGLPGRGQEGGDHRVACSRKKMGQMVGTTEEILSAYDKLRSQEGRIDFLMTRTLLSRERTETIDRLGNPWPMPTLRGLEGMDHHLEAMCAGEVLTAEGVNHLSALDAYIQMLDLEIERLGGRHESHPNPFDQGENNTLQATEGDTLDRISAHLKAVATLSGESYDTIVEFYLANIVFLQQMGELVGQFIQVRQKEEKKGEAR